MQLTHSFTVPAGIDETWAALNDIESVAGCFPGAQVTHADADSFEGTVKVKLGPIALVYKGSGDFVDKDEAAHRMGIAAKGKDKRGNGTAGADVVVTMAPEGAASTKVDVVTDLNITGKPAQFGRGVMQDVSDKLLGQFVDCLAGRFAAPEATPEPTGEEEAAATSPAQTPTRSTTTPEATAPASAAAPAASSPAVSSPAVSSPAARPASSSDDAIDLGATALPVLLRAYGPQIAAALAPLVLLIIALRRRKG